MATNDITVNNPQKPIGRLEKAGAVTPVAIAETEVILGEIADLAFHGDRMCFHMGSDGDIHELGEQLKFLRDLVGRLGWLADLGHNKLTGGFCTGDAEEWMLPPSYKWPSEEAAKAEHQTA